MGRKVVDDGVDRGSVQRAHREAPYRLGRAYQALEMAENGAEQCNRRFGHRPLPYIGRG